MTRPLDLAMPHRVRVRYWPRLMAREAAPLIVTEGLTFAEILRRLGVEDALWPHVIVAVGDPEGLHPPQDVDRGIWHCARPNAGTEVHVAVVPQGGGGQQGKNPLRTFLMLAVVAAAFVFAQPLGTAILGGASTTIFGTTITASQLGFGIISTIGGLLVNALVPPSQPKLAPLSAPQRESPTLSLTGARNRLTPFGPVPIVFGRHKVVPPFVAPPVSESAGKQQYMRLLFCFGFGPMELSDLRIGTTSIDEYEDVEYRIIPGDGTPPDLQIYTNVIIEDSHSIVLPSGEAKVQATRTDAVEITYDFGFQGLGDWDNGRWAMETVSILVEYREEGAVSWTTHATHNISAATGQAYRSSHRITNLSPARYELRVTKQSSDSTSQQTLNEAVLTTIRTVRASAPVTRSDVCLVEMRIRASEQLNGVVDEFSAIAEPKIRAWNGAEWVVQKTRHPAAAYLHVLTDPSVNRYPAADSEVDMTALAQWMEDEPDRLFDAVFDYRTTIKEMGTDILAAGRASPDHVDGKYTVVRDVEQTVPVQHFSPRNILSFKGRKRFRRDIHGFKVRFISPELDYRQDEITVYAPGYDAETATELEGLELFGVTDAEQAQRDALYHLAVAIHRGGEAFDVTLDIDHMRCTRGDFVRLSHDVPQIGVGAARIAAVTTAGSDVTAITLDDAMPMEAGKSYALQIRKSDGTELTWGVATVAGEQTVLTLSPAQPIAETPAVGDMVHFGEAGLVSLDVLVKEIRGGRQEQATLTLIPLAPAVWTADTGEIPPYVPSFTPDPRTVTPGVVQDLTLSEVLRYPGERAVSDVVATWQPPATGVPQQYRVFAQILGDGSWTQVATTDALSAVVVSNVAPGETVPVGVLAVSATGRSLTTAAMTQTEITIGGDTFPPADVLSLTVEEGLEGLRRLRWVAGGPDPDLAGFEIRVRAGSVADWASAIPLHEGLIPASPWETRSILPGQQTLLIKAVDYSGNKSAAAASATVTLGDVIADNLLETTDFRAGGWTGTITNGAVDGGGSLLGDDSGALMYPYAAELFYSGASGDLFYSAGAGDLFYPGGDVLFYDGAAGDDFYAGAFPQLTYTDTVTTTVAGFLLIEADGTGDRVLHYRASGASIWIPYNGPVKIAAGDWEVRLRVLSGGARGRLTVGKVHVDVPDVLERIDDATIAAAGTRLTLVQSYSTIKNVVLTVQDDGGSAETARVIDKSTSGPLVKCYDNSGTAVAGTVDAAIQGY